MIIRGNRGTITIDGVAYTGDNVVIRCDKVVVDGREQAQHLVGPISVVVQGNVHSVETSSGSIEVAGTAGSVDTMSGSVHCGNVLGGVETMSGNVTCGQVGGSVKTMSGEIAQLKGARTHA